MESAELFFNINDNSFSSNGVRSNSQKEQADCPAGQSNKSNENINCDQCSKKEKIAKDSCLVSLNLAKTKSRKIFKKLSILNVGKWVTSVQKQVFQSICQFYC